MRVDVIGKVRNTPLPLSQGLLPMFEAVINSIDAIEDDEISVSDGKIDIHILRPESLLDVVESPKNDIENDTIYGFEIHDNGVGFNDVNYNAFNEADTQFKRNRGGKGVGRFLWLVAFEKAEIDSSFMENGELNHRSFTFSLATPDGISNLNIDAETSINIKRTKVRLLGFKEKFEIRTPKRASTIAYRLLEHCLEYYVLGTIPRIRVIDGDEIITELDDLWDEIGSQRKGEVFEIGGRQFDLTHFLLRGQPDLRHRMCYCAHRRVVRLMNIGSRIPNLSSRISDTEGEGSYVYAGYVSGGFLDEHVNQQRTSFNIQREASTMFPDDLDWNTLEKTVLGRSTEFLGPYTEAVREEKEKRIQNYVAQEAPQYRHIVNSHPEQLDTIPPDATTSEIDTHLYEIERILDTQNRERAELLLSEAQEFQDKESVQEYIDEFTELWEEINESGKAKLAKYIIHRRTMLKFFENSLKRQDDSKYAHEKTVHQIVFPLRSTSDDIKYNQHNLWIVDEKLAYHRYLASDLPLSQLEVLESDSASRPDLLFFFDRAIAVVDEEPPYSSGVVLFEFKRPMRDDYDDTDNPITQVYGYVNALKRGKIRDKDGRPVNIKESTPFYCYIISDLTPRLKEQAEMYNLEPAPDAGGYFGFNSNLGAYVEIISFDKLLQDAKKRNRVLFDQLNLP